MGIQSIVNFSPGRMVLLSMGATVLCGVFLLALPLSHTKPLSLLDVLFTATSATCVCGLFTIPLAHFTLVGKAILLLLMQIGGLGLITMSLFFISLFVDLGLATQLMAGQLLEVDIRKNVQELLFFIIVVTLAIECLGAIGIFFQIIKDFPAPLALFFSIFHSVSAFCNAGISIFPTQLDTYASQNIFLWITTLLMFLGGIGFFTMHELLQYLLSKREKKWLRLSLQSKIALYGSCFVTGGTAIIFWFLERTVLFPTSSFLDTVSQTAFYAVSFRSTGFLLNSLYQMEQATWLLIMIASFIGTAPGSTGSGVKITAITILCMLIRAVMKKRNVVEMGGRRIAQDQLMKAVAIIILSIAWIFFATFFMLITDSTWQFFDLFFEVWSATCSLGISTGITPHLSFLGKIIIIISMLVGRVGSVSLILALRLRPSIDVVPFSYPEERIMLG